ncbi:alpha/beta hydrolase [Flavihumibacter stibioxidans]|uniref:Esterase n=1 Tax=Flavihumibacter stibioxidans TaxID=1834163 RepID=A0ABR7MA76_9BACT|nr:alpha/beta fold hydrolase [Flavihumibacter stibioxidans]MBC6491911.1 esterase [Flavihumibacter stibioxidans]
MRKKWLLAIPALLFVGYIVGPNPSTPVYRTDLPVLPSDAGELETHIKNKEAEHKIKPDNQARIVWFNDSIKQQTEYAIVYLHGFSASQFEGAPTHTNIARKFGANIYLSRLAEHGIDTTDALVNLTPEKYWESAKEALAIGKQLGRKLILMGTSTGGTNAIQLAATYPDDVHALILLSPNIAINDPNAWLLNNPWGLQVAKLVLGSPYRYSSDKRPMYNQYWNSPYRLEATVALEEMLETTMLPETFSKVKQPVLLLYYYKDEDNQDPVVKVSAMREMFHQLGTAPNLKKEISMPLTGDHVIGSPFKSRDAAGVEREIEQFMKQVVLQQQVSDSNHP